MSQVVNRDPRGHNTTSQGAKSASELRRNVASTTPACPNPNGQLVNFISESFKHTHASIGSSNTRHPGLGRTDTDQEQSGFRADALIHIHRELVGSSARIQMHLHSVYRSLEELQLTYIDAVLWLELQAAMDAQACFGDDFFRSKDLRRNLGYLRRKAPSMAMHVEAFEVALGKIGGVEQVPRLLFDDVGRVLRETKAIVSYSGTLQAMDIWRSMAIKHCQAHAFSQLKRVFDLLETERTGRAPGPRDGASTVAQWVDAIVSLYLGRPTLKPVPVELGPVDGSAARVPKAASTLLKERLAAMGFTGERVTKALEKKALIRMYANSAKSQEIYFRFQLTWMVLGYPSDEFREHFEEPPRPLPPDSQPEDYRSETITDSDAESVRSQPTPDGRPPK